MLSSSASVRKRVEEHARSMPSFILDSDSLDNYRPWMKGVREWTRRQGGIIMENHLIGEVVPASDLTPRRSDVTKAAIDTLRQLSEYELPYQFSDCIPCKNF